MSGGRASRDKGNRAEREVVRILQDAGLAAERIPLSGSAGGSFTSDVSVPVMGNDRKVEVKCRATGFAQQYRWLEGNYALVMRRDRDPPLICLRLKDFAELAMAADKRRWEAEELGAWGEVRFDG